MLKMIVALVVLLMSQSGLSARRYVSDVLYIPVRTGASNEHKIIGYLKSGDRVSTKGEDGEYTKVASSGEKKLEGWVKTRFLLAEPVAAIKLQTLKADLEKVEKMKTDLRNFEKVAKSATAEKDRLAKELAHIKKISSNVVELDNSNQDLKQNVDRLMSELESVKEQNIILGQNQRNEGIKLGILAIALGTLAGFVLPYMKPRQGRRNSSVRLR